MLETNEQGKVTNLCVMQSAAGYYIGREELVTGFPYSRESVEYYPTFEAAADALKNKTYTVRTWV